MSLVYKASYCFVLASILSTPIALAKKAPMLNFDERTLATEKNITGELLYLNDSENDTDLLIQDENTFVYYPNLVAMTEKSQEQVVDIPEQVQFYNVGTLANVNEQVLFYLTGDKVLSYHLKDKTLKELFSVESFYRYQTEFEAKPSDFIIDINKDGLSDVVTYSLDKTHLYIQDKDANFTQQTLPLAPKISSSDARISFAPYAFYLVDINGDNKEDIAFHLDNKLHSFVQQEDGSFASEPVFVELNAGFKSRREEKKQAEESGESIARVSMETIEDLNNDGVADLVTKERVKTGMMSFDNSLMVRFGQIDNGLLRFNTEPDTKAVFEGEGEISFKDINQDGLKDYYTRGVEVGLGTIMSAMSGSIDVDLNFYLMNDNGVFSKKPVFNREMEVAISDDSNGFGLNAIEDFDGDGILDLVVQSDDDEFKLYSGGGKKLFAKRGKSYDISMPVKGKTQIKDFNGDGKADILMLHGEKRDEDKKLIGKKQLVLWLSKS